MKLLKMLAAIILVSAYNPQALFPQCSQVGTVFSSNAVEAQPKSQIVVSGKYWGEHSGCELASHEKDIKILFVQGGRKMEIGRVDADEKYAFSTNVFIPADAEEGIALLIAEGTYSTKSIELRIVKK